MTKTNTTFGRDPRRVGFFTLQLGLVNFTKASSGCIELTQIGWEGESAFLKIRNWASASFSLVKSLPCLWATLLTAASSS